MKRFLIAGLAGVSVFGAAYGFAAAVNVTSDNFGSGDSVVASCEPGTDLTPGVNASYTTSYDPASKRYEVTAVKIEKIAAACDTQIVGVTLTTTGPGTTDVKVGDGSAQFLKAPQGAETADRTSLSVPIEEAPSASSVTGVHVVIRNGNSTSAETSDSPVAP